ncbi:SIR2 family protein [Brevibacillus porteri]|uniref:SIR2 family protein n=1 Tax=Brevibacillus porteri TaxID=2126350 RepID=UPI00370C7F4C
MAKKPVILVGSGTSAGVGISGMGALATWLIEKVEIQNLNPDEKTEWEKIKIRLLSDQMGLEMALQASGTNLTNTLTKEIVKQTWSLIAKDERIALLKISAGEDLVGFCRLFNRYQDTTKTAIHLITTNYDHLIEWSASAAGWLVWDGFENGSIARPLVTDELSKRMSRVVLAGKNSFTESIKHVRVYKPHGSLSWFKKPDGSLIRISNISPSDLSYLEEIGLSPVIVTPGTGKYLETHFEPYNNVMSEMNTIIRNASAFIFLGFGFNDEHILGSYYTNLRNNSIPKLILARTLSDTFHVMRGQGKITNYVAAEMNGNNSKIYSDIISEDLVLNTDIWTLNGMLSAAWGASV